jgi:tetratricopeptide (TPR) repeat protein
MVSAAAWPRAAACNPTSAIVPARPGDSWQHRGVTQDADRQQTPPDDDPDPWPAGPDDDRESAYGLLQRGQALLRSRDYAQAAIVLGRARLLEPRKGSILEALGRACYNSGQHELAREAFTALLDVDPSAHYAHYALGQSLKQLGFEREARTHLRLAVALAPASALYRGALARLPPAGPASEAGAGAVDPQEPDAKGG